MVFIQFSSLVSPGGGGVLGDRNHNGKGGGGRPRIMRASQTFPVRKSFKSFIAYIIEAFATLGECQFHSNEGIAPLPQFGADGAD